MAVEVHEAARRIEDPRQVSWGAILGGTFVALGVWALLYALGLALGLSAVDTGEGIGGPALFTGIWSVVSPLVALFAGGYVTGRLAGWFDKMAGALHGAVLWGITIVVGAFVLASFMGMLVGATASAGRAVASGLQGANPSQIQESLGLSTNQLLGPINERLQERGMPPVTAEGLQAAMQSAIGRSLQQGRLDGELFVSALADNTKLSRDEVRELVGDVGGKASALGTQVGRAAVTAAAGAAKAFWGVFFALLLGLVSSVLGALLGASTMVRHDRRAAVRLDRPVEVR